MPTFLHPAVHRVTPKLPTQLPAQSDLIKECFQRHRKFGKSQQAESYGSQAVACAERGRIFALPCLEECQSLQFPKMNAFNQGRIKKTQSILKKLSVGFHYLDSATFDEPAKVDRFAYPFT